MAFVTAPDFHIRSIEWKLDRPSQVNANAWTGTRIVVTDPWHGKWSAHVELATQQDESTFRTIRSFFARCRGTLNTFRIYATAGQQNSNTGVTLSANAAAGASTITISGAATPLTDGQFFTLNGQLCCCTADQSGSTLTFEPMLRQAAASGTIVVTSRPYALVYLADPSFAWQIASWRQFGLSFDVNEAIMETDGVVPEAGAAVLAPANTILPAITGTTQQGSTLTCSNGTWTNSPTSYAFQWKRNGANISSATASTYVLVAADVGTTITCTVTASNTGGSGSATATGVGPITSSPIATFTMTQLASAKRVYQRSTTTGGGQGKGQGTIPVTINVTVTGAIYARVRDSGGSTVVQSPWLVGTVGSTGSQTLNVTGVDARLGWFYLDLGDGASTWQSGSVLVGMGRVIALSGQSLAVRMLQNANVDTTTMATLGVTIDPNGSCYGQGDGQPGGGTPLWQVPADGSNTSQYNSAFAGEFLRLNIAAAGVNCALVGAAVGSTSITTWIGGGSNVSLLHTILDAVGGWEAFMWMQGHSDSLAGMSGATYQSDLTSLFADLTTHNAVRGSSFNKYVASIPNISSSAWGTPAQINTIRNASSAWAASNSAVYVQPADLNEVDGVHPGQAGAQRMAQHFYRAMRPALSLSHDDTGPSVSTATRAINSTDVVLNITMPSGASALSGVGSSKSRFLVASRGDFTPRPINSLLIGSSTITLTLASKPADNVPLDVWFGYPYDPAANGAADMIFDNNASDGDGLTNGRQMVVNLAASAVAAPGTGPTLTNNSATFSAGPTGFGQCLTAGNGTGSAPLADDVIPYMVVATWECRFLMASAPGALSVMFGADNAGWIGMNTSGQVIGNFGSGSITTSASYADNAWHHVALVLKSTGCELYIDGVSRGTDGNAYNPASASGTIELGGFLGSFTWPGKLQEVATWSAAKYTSGFTPPTAPYVGNETNLYALYHLNGNFNAG